jgi:hypothetical protein
MKTHRGINSTSIVGEGLGGLPGLIIAIAFLFFPLGFLLPRYIQRAYDGWILGIFLTVEIIACTLTSWSHVAIEGIQNGCKT